MSAFYVAKTLLALSAGAWYFNPIMHVCICLADLEGLRVFQPETVSTLRRFARLADHDPRRVAVWAVLDGSAIEAVHSLLEAADYTAAWRFLQNHSAHLGRLI